MRQNALNASGDVNGETNDAGLPDLLMIHGAGGTGKTMLPLAGCLETFANVRVLSLPGRDNPAAALDTIGELAAFLAGFVMAGSTEKPWIAGHSLGGAIALEAAAKWPELFSGLILVHTSTQMPLSKAFMDRLSGDWRTTMDGFLRKAYGPHADTALVEAGIALAHSLPKETIIKDFRACRTYNATAYLENISLPALILAGAEDALTCTDEAHLLKDQLQQSKLVIFPHTGHMGLLVTPEVEADEIRAFIRFHRKSKTF